MVRLPQSELPPWHYSAEDSFVASATEPLETTVSVQLITLSSSRVGRENALPTQDLSRPRPAVFHQQIDESAGNLFE